MVSTDRRREDSTHLNPPANKADRTNVEYMMPTDSSESSKASERTMDCRTRTTVTDETSSILYTQLPPQPSIYDVTHIPSTTSASKQEQHGRSFCLCLCARHSNLHLSIHWLTLVSQPIFSYPDPWDSSPVPRARPSKQTQERNELSLFRGTPRALVDCCTAGNREGMCWHVVQGNCSFPRLLNASHILVVNAKAEMSVSHQHCRGRLIACRKNSRHRISGCSAICNVGMLCSKWELCLDSLTNNPGTQMR